MGRAIERAKSRARDHRPEKARQESNGGLSPNSFRRAMPDGTDQRSSPEHVNLLHELAVHQTELEIQNEELQRARVEVEAGLDRYTKLFDFAPVGYACLSPTGKILEVNHVGARLCGAPRSMVMDAPFWNYVSPDDQSTVITTVRNVLADDISRVCEVHLGSSTRQPMPLSTWVAARSGGDRGASGGPPR